jgi:hypothetical protein
MMKRMHLFSSAFSLISVLVFGAANCDTPFPAPTSQITCIDCHRPGGIGIESAHPWAELSCVDCHGGTSPAQDIVTAHVAKPAGVFNPKQLAADQLDALPPDYLRFINPGDLRVASVSCGSGSPNSMVGTAGCHQGVVEKVSRSLMSTFAGHYNVPRFLSGLQDRNAYYGVRDIVHEEYDPETAPEGTVSELHALRPPSADEEPDPMKYVMDNYLVKSCPTCHAYSFGPNQAPGIYRSSGCTSCHMVYSMTGESLSSDPSIRRDRLPHPETHQLTSAIPTYQCAHCHFQGARIGLLFQGFREHGIESTVPPNAEFLAFSDDPLYAPYARVFETWRENPASPIPELYGHKAPYWYLTDEDTTNLYDETPPDLHFSAGMDCVDCHIGQDVHGDGNLYSTAKYQTAVKCEDCHGDVRQEITEDDQGNFRTSGGDILTRLRREGEQIFLKSRLSGQDHEVVQVKKVIEEQGLDSYAGQAMGIDPDTQFSHTDSVECYTCHTSYRLSCYGCHVDILDSKEKSDHQTGLSTTGASSGARDIVTIEDFFLGTNRHGKVATVCPSEQMFLRYKNEDSLLVLNNAVRKTETGKLGFGWNPNFQHTTARSPQLCSRCHIKSDGSNVEQVRGVYGFGTGEHMISVPNSDGGITDYDPTRILDADGEPIVDFAHEGSGPVSKTRIENALGITLDPSMP